MSETKYYVLSYWGIIQELATRRNQTRGQIRTLIRDRWNMDWVACFNYELDHPYHKKLKLLKDTADRKGITQQYVSIEECPTKVALRKAATVDPR